MSIRYSRSVVSAPAHDTLLRTVRSPPAPEAEVHREDFSMRAYELMVIIDGDVDDPGVKAVNARVAELVEADGGTIASTDLWGRRRYAYPINHKLEGIYVVFEISTPASNLAELDRFLRLADDVVRHKVIRLPEAEATKRGLLGAAAE